MDLAQQEQLHNNIDSRELKLNITEPTLPNTIAFNGKIISDLIDVGGGFIAFNILSGKEELEMPLILVKGDFGSVSKDLRKDDKIAGLGILKKVQNQFVIEVSYINRILTKKEFKDLL